MSTDRLSYKDTQAFVGADGKPSAPKLVATTPQIFVDAAPGQNQTQLRTRTGAGSIGLGPSNSPVFTGVQLTGLTPNELIGTDGANNLISVPYPLDSFYEMDVGRRMALLGGSSSTAVSALMGPGIGVDATGNITNIDGGRQHQFDHESLFNHQLLRYLNFPFFKANGTEQNIALDGIGDLPFFLANGQQEDIPMGTPLGTTITFPGPTGLTYLNDLGLFTTPSGLSPTGGLDILSVEVFL